MMIAALVAVIWSIRSINQHGLNPQIASAVGANRTAKLATRVDLCESRVQDLKTASGIELYENGLNWFMKKKSVEKKLDPIAVEKWFGKNCSVFAENLRPIALKETEAAKPVLIFGFVHGVTETLKEAPAGEYIWRQISFHSRQLTDALTQLNELREAGPHGRATPID